MSSTIRQLLRDLGRDKSGSVFVEYAMLTATVAMAIFGVVHLTADRLGDLLMELANQFPI